jgi:alpha-1,2-mannosyltransferase
MPSPTVLVPLVILIALPLIGKLLRTFLGWSLRKRTEGRRAHLLALMTEEDTAARRKDPRGSAETKLVFDVDDNLKNTLDSQKDWAGTVGFFHPFWYVIMRSIMGSY